MAFLESRNVYFQPDEDITLGYPAILYNQDFLDSEHADNIPYRRTKRYMITVIDRDPDSIIVEKVEQLPMCDFVRSYRADGLNHWIYSLYF